MDTAFTALGLDDRLAYAVQQKGYTEPTPIQAQAIPVVLAGKDVIGSAQTGTGKTAAFSLPILQKLGTHGAIRCLVLEPTRELALQVEESFKTYAKYTDLRTTVIYGGVGYGKQREDLARGMDILVATPGRLLDFMEQGEIRLDQVQVLVLDEVDRMLDMGFLPDVKRIVAKVAKERQTLFFTATLPPEIEQLAAWALRDPFKIAVSRERSTAETITHAFYPVVQAQKFDLLVHLLEQTQYHSVIIFSRTKSGADYVASRLKHAGHTCAVMHADRSQQERQRGEGSEQPRVEPGRGDRASDLVGEGVYLDRDVGVDFPDRALQGFGHQREVCAEPNHDAHLVRRALLVEEIRFGFARLGETALVNVGDNADHIEPRARSIHRAADLEPAAEGVAVGPIQPRETFVHDESLEPV